MCGWLVGGRGDLQLWPRIFWHHQLWPPSYHLPHVCLVISPPCDQCNCHSCVWSQSLWRITHCEVFEKQARETGVTLQRMNGELGDGSSCSSVMSKCWVEFCCQLGRTWWWWVIPDNCAASFLSWTSVTARLILPFKARWYREYLWIVVLLKNCGCFFIFKFTLQQILVSLICTEGGHWQYW